MEDKHDTHGRLSHLEGVMTSVATKADVQKSISTLKNDLTLAFNSAIKAQTTELNDRFDKQDTAIQELRDKETRSRAIGDTLKVIAPFVISLVALVIAALG